MKLVYTVQPFMIRQVRVNYLLCTQDTWDKIELACTELGWNKSEIVKQMLHGFFARDLKESQFYAKAGIADAEARGMTEAEYFRTLRDDKEPQLLPYVSGRPVFGQSPIDTIPPLPTDEDLRRKYNTIGLSAYNYVLLRVAQIVHDSSFVQIVSRMLVKHLQDSWETSYRPQIERDQNCRFL